MVAKYGVNARALVVVNKADGHALALDRRPNAAGDGRQPGLRPADAVLGLRPARAGVRHAGGVRVGAAAAVADHRVPRLRTFFSWASRILSQVLSVLASSTKTTS